ncbi:hypothetical protein C8R45DRAFT_936646 [Mycena sanguinolenta]|nr:hypothetical protein C8R45DRAFT_936646 [Mycena sanguinolenta]
MSGWDILCRDGTSHVVMGGNGALWDVPLRGENAESTVTENKGSLQDRIRAGGDSLYSRCNVSWDQSEAATFFHHPQPCEMVPISTIWAKNASFPARLCWAYWLWCSEPWLKDSPGEGLHEQFFRPTYGGHISCPIANHSGKIAPEKGYMDDPDPCKMLVIWAKKSKISGPPATGNGTSHRNQWDITCYGHKTGGMTHQQMGRPPKKTPS